MCSLVASPFLEDILLETSYDAKMSSECDFVYF